jgi:hypothetical protein
VTETHAWAAGENVKNARRSPTPYKREIMEKALYAILAGTRSETDSVIDLEGSDDLLKLMPQPHESDVSLCSSD